jgi:aryl carrier-like protein
MYRDEAIELMNKTVNDFNRNLIGQGMMSVEDMENFIKTNEESLRFMNSLLYDTLKENGVII